MGWAGQGGTARLGRTPPRMVLPERASSHWRIWCFDVLPEAECLGKVWVTTGTSLCTTTLRVITQRN
jgi:hypothetical protein